MFEDIINNVISTIDGQAVTTIIGVGAGSLVSAILYSMNKTQRRKASKLDDAVPLVIDDSLKNIVNETPLSTIPYVCISGHVNTSSHPLSSIAIPERKGVVWNKTITESKDVWSNSTASYWYDKTKEISNVTDSIPFYLTSLPSHVRNQVNVIDPLDSKWTMNSLEKVHQDFKPVNNSRLDQFIGYVVGDRIKGYIHTEKMMTLGAHLYGYGELVCEDHVLKLRPPTTNFAGEYIITNLAPELVKNKFLSSAKVYTVFAIFFGIGTAVALYYGVRCWFRKYKQYCNSLKEKKDYEEIKQMRVGNAAGRQLSEDDTCIICLTNPRECVLLNCGHVCLCVDCYYALETKICPMCREAIERTVPLFHV